MTTRLVRRAAVAAIDAGRRAGSKVFPGHGSFLLGEIAMFSFLVLVATGVYLAIFYEASSEPMTYSGSYEPMVGVEVSRSYASVMDVTFDRPGGWVIRQTHHWAAVVFVAALTLHAARVFFTGAFRRPRRLNWTIGVTLLVLAMGGGYLGLALPHDLLGGTGARIGHAELLSVPVIGPGLVDLVFAGEFGNAAMLHRFWLLHVIVVPILIAMLLGAHLYLVWKQTHTQFPSPERAEDNVVGDRAWPVYVLKSTGLALFTAGTLALMGSLFEIAPIWLYGPFDAASSTVPAQPDWYLGWVEGALRIVPSTEFVLFGRWEVPNAFAVGIVVPVLVLGVLYAWPFLEERLTGDDQVHHLLDRPRDRPGRTALGVAGLAALVVLTLAGSHDLAALLVRVPVERVTTLYRWLLVVVPPLAGLAAYWTCRTLVADDAVRRGRSRMVAGGDHGVGAADRGPASRETA
jgi:ubiquinol-cytochrome c reductase cytochrome b subunit